MIDDFSYVRPTDEETLQETLKAKGEHLNVPGGIVEFDPEEADRCGAFEETGLSEEDALEAAQDVISYE